MMDILIVDDDHEDSEVLTEALAEVNDNLKCIRVNTGVAALTFLHYEPAPALIFLDGRLNGMSSHELLKKLRDHDEWKNIPVVMYTGFSCADAKREFLPLGADQFLAKTGDYQKLKNDVRQLVHERTVEGLRSPL